MDTVVITIPWVVIVLFALFAVALAMFLVAFVLLGHFRRREEEIEIEIVTIKERPPIERAESQGVE